VLPEIVHSLYHQSHFKLFSAFALPLNPAQTTSTWWQDDKSQTKQSKIKALLIHANSCLPPNSPHSWILKSQTWHQGTSLPICLMLHSTVHHVIYSFPCKGLNICNQWPHIYQYESINYSPTGKHHDVHQNGSPSSSVVRISW